MVPAMGVATSVMMMPAVATLVVPTPMLRKWRNRSSIGCDGIGRGGILMVSSTLVKMTVETWAVILLTTLA